MYFTQHAIRRFRQRWAPALSYGAAVRELVVLSQSSVLLREKTYKGDLQFKSSDGAPIVFVCKREPGNGRDGLVCVTVLPEPAPASDPAQDPG